MRSWLAAGKTERRLAFRAQIILVLAEGLSNKAAAARLATRPATVSKWRGRFARHGLAGVADAPRSGKPRHYQTNDERRIIAALDASPPAGYARWNGTLLAKHLGDISKHQIWRVLREHEISLERRRSWCISTDPAFAQKAADVVALFQEIVDGLNRDLSQFERIKKIRLLPREFTLASGELTPTMKVKRKAVEQNWAGEIEEIYREH